MIAVDVTYAKTSQGTDVFVSGKRLGTIIECPVLNCVFLRTPDAFHTPYPSVEALKAALKRAAAKAARTGAMP